MGVDRDSVLMDLDNQPEVRHQRGAALLLVQGWTLALRVTAAAVVAFGGRHGDALFRNQEADRKKRSKSGRSRRPCGQNSPCVSESRLPWLETTL